MQLTEPYLYGTFGCMKKTVHIDDRLLAEAKAACEARTDTDTIRLGLEALVRHAAQQRLRALRGTEPRALQVPRRRELPGGKRRTKRRVA
jgi:Arc/MetJ family transcription regulator